MTEGVKKLADSTYAWVPDVQVLSGQAGRRVPLADDATKAAVFSTDHGYCCGWAEVSQ